MNGAFVHLAVNHIPVIGLPFATLLLLGGLARQSRELIQAAFVATILVALISIVAFKSGGPAAHNIKGQPGVTRETVRSHAEAADKAFWGVEALGVLSLVGLWLAKRSESTPQALAVLVLLGGLGISIWLGYVAHLGGLIRHPEIGPGWVVLTTPTAAPGSPAPAPAH